MAGRYEETVRLTPEEALMRFQQEEKKACGRGRLKVFLGYAPGVGKTFMMLNEGNRLYARGRDVVIGYFEDHGREKTREQIGSLPIIPRKTYHYNQFVMEEMDTEAIIARHPYTVLVDELAHTNCRGMKHRKRYEDVLEILEHGINVYTTVNLQHLESLNDRMEKITDIRVQETLPDWVIREADEIVVADIEPVTLQNRLKRGDVYKLSKVPAALSNFFREGNLAALRELTLRQAAEHVDDRLLKYREAHKIEENWETRERIMVAVSANPLAEGLVRRGIRMAERFKCELYVVYVHCTHGMAPQEDEKGRQQIARIRTLAARFGATLAELTGKSVSAELLKYAEQNQITKVVLGHSRRSKLQQMFRGSTIQKFIDQANEMEIIVVPYPKSE